MKKSTIYWIVGGVVLALIIAVSVYGYVQTTKPGPYDHLATCLKTQGVLFYGAFWCPHCQAQKAAFGNSAKLLPYVECSTPDANGQTQVCIDKGIQSYPTWIFPNGARVEGVQDLSYLAATTSCPLN